MYWIVRFIGGKIECVKKNTVAEVKAWLALNPNDEVVIIKGEYIGKSTTKRAIVGSDGSDL